MIFLKWRELGGFPLARIVVILVGYLDFDGWCNYFDFTLELIRQIERMRGRKLEKYKITVVLLAPTTLAIRKATSFEITKFRTESDF